MRTNQKYDYLIVGAGLFGSTLAHDLAKNNKRIILVEARDHVGGQIYTEEQNQIHMHKYGPHIFYTSNKDVWQFVNNLVDFIPFINSPIAIINGKVYNLPFNMHTFHQLWGVITPAEAQIEITKKTNKNNGDSLESHAISMVGKEIYEMFIKEYTEKQWGKSCKHLPKSIISRIPLRFTYNNNYYNHIYQGIPKGGYTKLITQLLHGCPVILETDYVKNQDQFKNIADNTIYTGRVDHFHDYRLGELEYRGVVFKEKWYQTHMYQGNPVINYPLLDVPYTRSIEHKLFDAYCRNTETTVVSYEYPVTPENYLQAYYPINDAKNMQLYQEYLKMPTNVMFGGRLGSYQYWNMDETIVAARKLARRLL